jgi:hypothetical protein
MSGIRLMITNEGIQGLVLIARDAHSVMPTDNTAMCVLAIVYYCPRGVSTLNRSPHIAGPSTSYLAID